MTCLNDDESAVNVNNVNVGAVQLAEDVGRDDVVNRADSVAIRRKIQHAVGDVDNGIDRMRDENDGRVVVASLCVDSPDRLFLRSIIQAEQGFIAQEDIGVRRDRAGLTDQLLLAA